jgi:3-deoxy-D-manno-octulosonic-acid transferase
MPVSVRLALSAYEGLWRAAAPLLGRHPRLREGLPQRMGRTFPEGPFDLWIQAASAGEAYLAQLLLEALGSAYRILVTVNTRQGMDLIRTAIRERWADDAPAPPLAAYFPFDRPALMRRALTVIKPRLVVLLETEIWPGLLSALRAGRIPALVVNGRMRAKSLRHYRLWPRFWQALAPARILAVSAEDAERYTRLFGPRRVAVMPNMKFDRIRTAADGGADHPLGGLLPPRAPFAVLGSVRREEEEAVEAMLLRLRDHRRDVVIGLFPRHMHRLAAWRSRLEAAGIPYTLRSRATSTVAPGMVILWDVFGELAKAYAAAQAAFVGGSLAPLGGQNFLEALSCGVVATIGPSWETFRWVGEDLFRQGLVRVARDGGQAADLLLATLAAPPPRRVVQKALADYVAACRGGTAAAAAVIEDLLKASPTEGRGPTAADGAIS